MAANKEMISSTAPIPVRIPIRHNANVIRNDILQAITVVIHTGSVEVPNSFGHTDGNKEGRGFEGVAGQKGAFAAAL